MLFTHRGLSGPAVLQISSYWREGESIAIALRPEADLKAEMAARRHSDGRKQIATVLADWLPRALVAELGQGIDLTGRLADASDRRLDRIAEALADWRLTPTGTEGYRTAEVTLGGVDTAGLDSRTMEARKLPGLYFIGEVVDVTGWLGGYNFQWAWSSGWAAGQAIAARL